VGSIVAFVVEHGYYVLFAAIFLHQLGFPIPGPLFLVAAGALAASGKLAIIPALFLSIVACVLADWIWYEAAQRRGDKVLHFIHRLASRNPDYHDRRAKAIFAKYGVSLLLIAKFVPGLDAVTPPLAGTSRTSRLRFLSFDAIGAGAYSGAYAGLGGLFRDDLDRVAAYVGRAGTFVGSVVFVALFIFAASRFVLWRRYRHDSRVVQTALSEAMQSEEPVAQPCAAPVRTRP